jgi:hypothetical protein
MEANLKIKIAVFLILAMCTLLKSQDQGVISREYIDKMMSSVEQLRGVKFKSKVDYEIVNREQMLKVIKDEISRQYNKDDIMYMDVILKLLKIVDASFNLEEFMDKLYQEQAGGLYDARSKKLYIADWIQAELLDIVLFHELVHALDDQYYDLEKFAFSEKSSDVKMAHLSIIEGIGTYYMLEYTFEKFGMDAEQMKDVINFDVLYRMQDINTLPGMDAIGNAPKYLIQQLLFPYFKGAGFVSAFIKANSEKRLSELYTNPPVSTEQIMHIERYTTDKPGRVEIKLDRKKLKGWGVVYSDEMGEMGLNLMLNDNLSVDESDLASEGWNGDRLILLKNGDKYGLIMRIAWDSEKDVGEFRDNFVKWFSGKEEKEGNVSWLVGDGINCLLQVKDLETVMILGEMERGVANAIMKSMNIGGK